MSKKSGLTEKETKLLVSQGFFNRRYIVRNILAATALITFLVFAIGISAVVTGDAASDEDEITTENKETGFTVKQDEKITEIVTSEATEEVTEEPIYVIETSDSDKYAEATEDVKEDEAGVSVVETTPVSDSKYANRFIAIESGINIRSGADTDCDSIAYLEQGMVGEFLGTEGSWSKISVGDLEGYVNSDYILVGDEAAKYAEENGFDIDVFAYYEAVEDTENDSLDEETTSDSEETTEDIDDEEDDIYDLEDEETVDSENEAVDEDTYEIVEEETVVEEVENEDSNNSNDEDAETEADSDKSEEKTSNEGGSIVVDTVNRGAYTLSEEDITTIAGIVALEAGSECYEGQVAVANIVLNRLDTGLWGGTVHDVCYAQNQFDVVYFDSFKQYVKNGASGVALQATLDAVAGNNNIAGYLSYRPTYLLDSIGTDQYTIIGNHVFF